jgi:hypothetical protein
VTLQVAGLTQATVAHHLAVQNGRRLATPGQVLQIASAMALKTSGVLVKPGLSLPTMSPVDDTIGDIVHEGSRSLPHIYIGLLRADVGLRAGP